MINNSSYEPPFILYVEDDKDNRKVISLIFEKKMGLKNYAIFEDSEHFTEKLARLAKVPDIILLDIHMKPYNGFEVLQMLRSSQVYQYTKIIALTASVMNEDVDKMRTSGFDGVISKPINFKTFPELIFQIMKGEQVWVIY